MKFSEYSEKAATFILKNVKGDLLYSTLGICGEAGEIAEKIKKGRRDGEISTAALELEIGDVLWYLSKLATEIGSSLELAAEANIKKLSSREFRGKIMGSGDNR